MVSIRGVGEHLSEDFLVYFGAKPIQRAWAWDFLQDGKKMRKGKVTEQKGVSDCQEKVTVIERQLLKEELGPVDPESRSANTRGWVSVPCSCVGILFKYTLMRATEAQNARKVPKLLPSYT